MRFLFFILFLTFPATAFGSGDHSIALSTGFDNGGLHLGADYEYHYHHTYGIGGYARFFQKDDGGNDDKANPGVTAMGAFIRPHFARRQWKLSMAPGFGIVNYESGNDSDMGIGPSLSIDVLYQISSKLSLGLEYLTLHSWFNANVPTPTKNNLAFRLKFSI